MRRYLFLLLVVACSIKATFAQTEEMKFVGIPMNQTQSSFISALKQKGFTDNVNQLKWNFEGYNCITLAGSFWKFDDCEIRVKYSIATDSVASVAVRKQFFSIWNKKLYELMDNLDLKYGKRICTRDDINNSEYRWISKDPFGMVEVSWVLMKNVQLDLFMIEYFTSNETRKTIGKEIVDKKAELDEL